MDQLESRGRGHIEGGRRGDRDGWRGGLGGAVGGWESEGGGDILHSLAMSKIS